jgi:hypothetical protein
MSFPVKTRVVEVEGIEPPGIGGERSGKGAATRMEGRRQVSEHDGGDRRLVG